MASTLAKASALVAVAAAPLSCTAVQVTVWAGAVVAYTGAGAHVTASVGSSLRVPMSAAVA